MGGVFWTFCVGGFVLVEGSRWRERRSLTPRCSASAISCTSACVWTDTHMLVTRPNHNHHNHHNHNHNCLRGRSCVHSRRANKKEKRQTMAEWSETGIQERPQCSVQIDPGPQQCLGDFASYPVSGATPLLRKISAANVVSMKVLKSVEGEFSGSAPTSIG